MRRLLIALTAVFLMTSVGSPRLVAAQPGTHVTGGGTGTFDGTDPGSQFGMGVMIASGGSAKGSFNCVMAGRSAFGTLHLMKITGKVDSGTVGLGTASFSGNGTLHVDNVKDEVTFTVAIIQEGGPGAGMFQLTVSGIDVTGFPAVVAFPAETVLTGQIKIH